MMSLLMILNQYLSLKYSHYSILILVFLKSIFAVLLDSGVGVGMGVETSQTFLTLPYFNMSCPKSGNNLAVVCSTRGKLAEVRGYIEIGIRDFFCVNSCRCGTE